MRPQDARRTPDPLDDPLRLRVQSVPIGVAVTYTIVAALVVWVVATWGEPHREVMAALLGCAVVTATGVILMPYERIVRSRWREPFFVSWSAANILLIAGLAAADGGTRSPATLVFFLTMVFSALSYPFALVVMVSASSVFTYVGIAVLQPSAGVAAVRPAAIFVFATCLVLVAFMCIWQARLNARHMTHLKRISRADPLTGCLNRLGFLERFEVELRAPGARVGLVLLDLVGFKGVNDTHGHPAGDELLVWVSHTLQALIRSGDAVARLGGDEFALILPGLDSSGAAGVAERTRGALAERIRATVGVAGAPADGTEPDALVRAADERLYAGRATTVDR